MENNALDSFLREIVDSILGVCCRVLGEIYLPAGISAPGDNGNTADLEDYQRELALPD